MTHQQQQILCSVKFLNSQYKCEMMFGYEGDLVVLAHDDGLHEIRFPSVDVAVAALHSAPAFGPFRTLWGHLSKFRVA